MFGNIMQDSLTLTGFKRHMQAAFPNQEAA